MLTLLVKKKVTWIFAGSCLYYDNPRKNSKSNLVLHVFESKDLSRSSDKGPCPTKS